MSSESLHFQSSDRCLFVRDNSHDRRKTFQNFQCDFLAYRNWTRKRSSLLLFYRMLGHSKSNTPCACTTLHLTNSTIYFEANVCHPCWTFHCRNLRGFRLLQSDTEDSEFDARHRWHFPGRRHYSRPSYKAQRCQKTTDRHLRPLNGAISPVYKHRTRINNISNHSDNL